MDVDMDQDKEIETTNNEKKKTKKPTASFASMNFCQAVVKAVLRKGYKLATPIQRKCIPLIMSGRDVVAMARTGSGKSAAFLLPIIDKLKARQPKQSIRCLIVSPTRELATQTYTFAKDFARYTSLVTKLIIGGESINRDFETIISCPDILITTPGRLAHVLIEMKKKLNDVEIVVFDEADRLFEPGFKELEQVNEICDRLNNSKQTLLFSATMPQKLIDFAKAGLKYPEFVRLDVECTLSDTLKSVHLHCNQSDKFAILMHLLKNFVKIDQLTVVFMPTRHHVEYATMLLERCKINSSCVYSSLDAEARKINVGKFTSRKCNVMLVTDIAARGIDIPLLDVVINFNFPFKPKLYIHRVGRVARAGRFGCAISLVAHDETQYLHDLQLFFSKPLNIASELTEQERSKNKNLEDLKDMVFGSVPQKILDYENDILNRWHDHDVELKAMVRVCDNAMKPYLKTRNSTKTPTSSVTAAKELNKRFIGYHPMFGNTTVEDQAASMLEKIRSYKPNTKTVLVPEAKQIPKSNAFADEQHYLKYKSDLKEEGLAMDLMGDDENQLKSQRSMIWDRKKKKYTRPENNGPKKIRTESGALISASYSSGLFDKWKKQSRSDYQEEEQSNTQSSDKVNKLRRKLNPPMRRRKEIKNYDEMLKERNIKTKREYILKQKISRKTSKNSTNKSSNKSMGKSSRKSTKQPARKPMKKPTKRR